MARKSRKNLESNLEENVRQSVFYVGAYVRLSAVDRKKKGDSIETQQAIISAFIAGRSDLELVKTYIDDGVTGQTIERPAFKRMREDFESGKINCCVTKDLSRLGRNAIDTSYYIDKYFPTHKIRYIAINDGYDSAEENSGGIIVNLKNIANETVALEVGRKIRATKQMNIRAGYFVGRITPYGYLKSPESKYKLVPDEYAAPIVKRMFEMAAKGISVSNIAKWLNDANILPPKRYLHSIGLASEKEADGHIHWNKGILYGILHNQIYCGDMVQGKGTTHSYIRRKIPRSEWVITENTHMGVVSRELFADVQKRWPKKDKSAKSRYKTPSTENIFLRRIFCGHCDHAMRRTRTGENQYCFVCETRRYYGEDDCVLVSINENELKEKLLAILQAKASVFTDADKFTAVEAKEDDAYKVELRKTQTELKKNAMYFKSLYESFVKGIIENEEEYKRMKQFYGAKIDDLAAKEKQLMETARNRYLKKSARDKAADSFQSVKYFTGLTAKMVDSLVEKIYVCDNKSIEVYYKFNDETEGVDHE